MIINQDIFKLVRNELIQVKQLDKNVAGILTRELFNKYEFLNNIIIQDITIDHEAIYLYDYHKVYNTGLYIDKAGYINLFNFN